MVTKIAKQISICLFNKYICSMPIKDQLLSNLTFEETRPKDVKSRKKGFQTRRTSGRVLRCWVLEELCRIEQYSQSLAGERLEKTEVQSSHVGILVFVEVLCLNSTSQSAIHLNYVMDLFWDISDLQILYLLPLFSFCNSDCVSNASHPFLSLKTHCQNYYI